MQLAGTVDSEADAVAALQRQPGGRGAAGSAPAPGHRLRCAARHSATIRCRKIVVIVLTNYDLAEYRRAAAALGARHFLDKLRDFDRLPMLLQQIGADSCPT